MENTRHEAQGELEQESVEVSVKQETSICRGCLTTEHRMVNAMLFDTLFRDLTGITISPTDGLPQWLCYECSALFYKYNRFRSKVIKSHHKLCQYVLASAPLEEQVDDAVCIYDMLYETVEDVKMNDEPMFSDYEDYIKDEEYREESPQFQLESSLPTSDLLDINSRVTLKHEEQAKEGEAARMESLVVTEAARHSLRARLRFDDDICGDVEEPTTHSNDYEQINANEIQGGDDDNDESCKYNDILAKCEQVNDRNDVNSSSRSKVQPYDKERQNPANSTSTPHRDDAEEELEHNIQRHSSVNSNLRSNVCVHTGNKPYKCDVCMKCFALKSNLNKHMQLHTGDKPYKCDVCVKCFGDKAYLKKHMRLHTDDKPYKCDVCMKCFPLKYLLNKHMRLHTAEKPYKCDVCTKHFSYQHPLTNHMRVHTGDKPYKCDVCMKCFGQKGNLNTHMRLHTDGKPHKCDLCMKRFSYKKNLKTHMRVHTGYKPYKCDVCMKRFKYKTNLMNHMHVHTGDKPYKCDVCMKCFGQKGNLKTHMHVHTGDKPYKCDVCKKCFGLKGNLNKHMQLHTACKPY